MPPVTRRQEPPKPQSQVTVPQDSILATSVPVSCLGQGVANICIYGRNRSGKTTLAAQAAKRRKPMLFISCEPDSNGGADSIKSMEGIHLQRVSHRLLGRNKDNQWVDAEDPSCVVRDTVKGSAKVVALANALKGNHPYKDVALDTSTSLQDIILVELMGLHSVPDQLSWGTVPEGVYQARSEKLRETIRPLLDVKNCNKYILCQEKDHNDTGEARGKSVRKLRGSMQQDSFFGPSIGSAVAGWLQDACGYVIQIHEDEVTEEIQIPQMNPDGTPAKPIIQRVGTGIRQRHLRLQYHPNFAAGGRIEFVKGLPEFVTAPDPEGLYSAMAKFIPALQ